MGVASAVGFGIPTELSAILAFTASLSILVPQRLLSKHRDYSLTRRQKKPKKSTKNVDKNNKIYKLTHEFTRLPDKYNKIKQFLFTFCTKNVGYTKNLFDCWENCLQPQKQHNFVASCSKKRLKTEHRVTLSGEFTAIRVTLCLVKIQWCVCHMVTFF